MDADAETPRGSRRRFLRDGAILALGVGVGVTGLGELQQVSARRAVVGEDSAASTIDGPHGVTGQGQLAALWEVKTDHPLVALTFDDGPAPQWTTMVLDTLDRYQVPATFFMIGERLRANAGVVRGRMAQHEVGNHTWDHHDLALLDYEHARVQLERAHEQIADVISVAPRLCRPPFGHVGGAASLAAAELGYRMVFWSRKMHEAHYNTCQQVAAVLRETVPGTIMLAHDVGHTDRLVALKGLPAMIAGLRDRGFEFVTVSQLLARSEPVV